MIKPISQLEIYNDCYSYNIIYISKIQNNKTEKQDDKHNLITIEIKS